VARAVYLDTSIFLELGTKRSRHKAKIRQLLSELQKEKIRIYTSMVTVQEVAVATFRAGTVAKDPFGDINAIARVYGITKEVALTAAKYEAKLKDLADEEARKRDPKKLETEEQKLERICQNRRRKWDCFHIATAQQLDCQELYTTDGDMRKRPEQLGIRSFKALAPCESVRTIKGPMFEKKEP
jgi:predicted nucleic acid-binding protein